MRFIKTLIWVVLIAIFLQGADLVVGLCEILSMEKGYFALEDSAINIKKDDSVSVGTTTPTGIIEKKVDVDIVGKDKSTNIEEKAEPQPVEDANKPGEIAPTVGANAPVIKDEGDKKVVEGYIVDKTDYLKSMGIILNKLSKDEIKYLFGRSKKSNSKEELLKIRETLLAKLTSEDVRVLREVGKKYGKKLDILDPNIPIK